MFEDDDFDIEDVDFVFTDETEEVKKNNLRTEIPKSKKIKKSESDFVHSVLEQSCHNSLPALGKYNVTSNHHTRQSSSEKSKNIRKFPGPAGLLPQRSSFNFSFASDCDPLDSTDVISKNEREIEQASSQYSSVFDTQAWKSAMKDLLQINFSGVQDCNISHLKRIAFSNKSKAMKYPFLVAAVSNVDDIQESIVTLKDKSGDISAYINSEVFEQFQSDLRSGSVIVLKKVGVLKSGQGRGMYLLVTPNNVVIIYPPESETSQLSQLTKACKDVECNFSLPDDFLNSTLDFPVCSPSLPKQGRTPHSNTRPKNTSSSLENKFGSNVASKQIPSNLKRPEKKSTPNFNSALRKPLQCSSINQVSARNFHQDFSRVCDTSSAVPLKSINSEHNSHVFMPKTNNNAKSDSSTLNKSISMTVLSQNGITNAEDLSTMNDLFDGVDTESIFGDF